MFEENKIVFKLVNEREELLLELFSNDQVIFHDEEEARDYLRYQILDLEDAAEHLSKMVEWMEAAGMDTEGLKETRQELLNMAQKLENILEVYYGYFRA